MTTHAQRLALAKLNRDIARAYRAFARQSNPHVAAVSANRSTMHEGLARAEEQAAAWIGRTFDIVSRSA